METSTLRVELKTEILSGEIKYIVLTENSGTGNDCYITSRVFRDGEPVYTNRKSHGKLANALSASALEPLIVKHHAEAIEAARAGRIKGGKPAPDFLEEARSHLRKKANRKALEVLESAISIYPDDPFLLSYYGCMASVVDGRHVEGIMACRRAIEALSFRVPHGREAHYPTFYLNLSRALLAAGDKKGAVEALYQGAPYEHENGQIHKELVKLGIRREPPVKFFSRSNPINKYIGLLTHRMRK